MRLETAAAGFCHISASRKIPKLQIITINDLFDGRLPDLPDIDIRATHKKIASERQKRLDI